MAAWWKTVRAGTLLGLVFMWHLPARSETRLKAAWQEYSTTAIWPGGDSYHLGGGGVPGGRRFDVSGFHQDAYFLSSARATTQQNVSLLFNGFEITGASYTRLTNNAQMAWASSLLMAEIEIPEGGRETVHFELDSLSLRDDFTAHAGFRIDIQKIDENGDAVESSSRYFQENDLSIDFNLEGGRYRFVTDSSILSNTFPLWINREEIIRSTEFAGRVTFSNFVVMPGAFQSHPILPDEGTAFNDVPSGLWYDPPLASGFKFTAKEGTAFEDIMAFPVGFGSNFHVYVDGVKVGEAAGGESFSFKTALGAPVTAFEIRNIIPFVDGESPTAFPVMLRFARPTGSFTMTPIDAPVVSLSIPETGGVRIDFTGVLQRSDSLKDGSWRDVEPKPVSPVIIPPAEIADRMFFRAREP